MWNSLGTTTTCNNLVLQKIVVTIGLTALIRMRAPAFTSVLDILFLFLTLYNTEGIALQTGELVHSVLNLIHCPRCILYKKFIYNRAWPYNKGRVFTPPKLVSSWIPYTVQVRPAAPEGDHPLRQQFPIYPAVSWGGSGLLEKRANKRRCQLDQVHEPK